MFFLVVLSLFVLSVLCNVIEGRSDEKEEKSRKNSPPHFFVVGDGCGREGVVWCFWTSGVGQVVGG